jgi:integrase
VSFEILLQNIDDKDLSELVEFAVNTGLRQGELIRLEWAQINFKDRFVILDNRNYLTKSKRVRTVQMNIRALQILT